MEYIKVSRLSDYESEENRWLWRPYIAQGTVSLISGSGGKGKSFMSMAIAAAVTRGLPLPGDVAHLPPSNVILSNLENHRKRMVRPRADIVGADSDRIVLFDEDDARLTLTDDRLEHVIIQENAALAIIDPLQAHLPKGVSMNNAESIRPVFTHLARVAERTNCAIVLVGHINKGNSASSDRLLGSADIYNSVLSAMIVGRIDKEQGISAFVHHKSNMDELGASQAFRIYQNKYEWLGECDATASDVLREGDSCGESSILGAGSKLDYAKSIIQEYSGDEPLSSKELFNIAAENGVSMATYRRARDELGMTKKHGSKNE